MITEQLILRKIGINSAYAACGMVDRKPWTYKNDMCVRTLVRTAGDLLGRDFAKEERFQGTRHDALDDCRHQIRYMVKARNAMRAISAKPKSPPGLSMALPVCEAKAAGPDDVLEASAIIESAIPLRHTATSQDISDGLGIEKLVNETPRKPALMTGEKRSPEGVPDPQGVFPRTVYELSPSPRTVKLQKEFPTLVRAEDDADVDALVQAAYEAYLEERTPRTSQDIAVVSLGTVRDSLGDRSKLGRKELCEQDPEGTPALDLAVQLEKLNVA